MTEAPQVSGVLASPGASTAIIGDDEPTKGYFIFLPTPRSICIFTLGNWKCARLIYMLKSSRSLTFPACAC